MGRDIPGRRDMTWLGALYDAVHAMLKRRKEKVMIWVTKWPSESLPSARSCLPSPTFTRYMYSRSPCSVSVRPSISESGWLGRDSY